MVTTRFRFGSDQVLTRDDILAFVNCVRDTVNDKTYGAFIQTNALLSDKLCISYVSYLDNTSALKAEAISMAVNANLRIIFGDDPDE